MNCCLRRQHTGIRTQGGTSSRQRPRQRWGVGSCWQPAARPWRSSRSQGGAPAATTGHWVRWAGPPTLLLLLLLKLELELTMVVVVVPVAGLVMAVVADAVRVPDCRHGRAALGVSSKVAAAAAAAADGHDDVDEGVGSWQQQGAQVVGIAAVGGLVVGLAWRAGAKKTREVRGKGFLLAFALRLERLGQGDEHWGPGPRYGRSGHLRNGQLC
eukprot:1139225-Pelagomonas_calceolata.AAC.5